MKTLPWKRIAAVLVATGITLLALASSGISLVLTLVAWSPSESEVVTTPLRVGLTVVFVVQGMCSWVKLLELAEVAFDKIMESPPETK